MSLGALEAAWARSDELLGLLRETAWFARPIRLRHPFLFYLGHLPAFAWGQLGRQLLGRQPVHAAFEDLFVRGIDPVSEPEADARQASRWPTLDEVRDFRDRARDALRAALPAALAEERGSEVLGTVIEHELMHHETLLYMLQELPDELRRAPASPEVPARAAARRPAVAIPEGVVVLGRERDGAFGWDNEFGRQEEHVLAFRLDATPVTVGDYRDFLEECESASPPRAWRRREGTWWHRTLQGDVPLEEAADWPVSVSGADACAYARWRGARLPTEAELQRAAGEGSHPWGEAPPDGTRGNFGLSRWRPAPVGSHPAGRSAFGVDELVGNGWEWTASAFAPFPGFAPMAHYPGYSADFFDGQHLVLLGASWATDVALVRKSFRNWFRADYPYVFSKFRLAWPG